MPVPIEVVDRLMSSERPDPVLILCKAVDWGWPTAKAIFERPPWRQASGQTLDTAFTNFEQLVSGDGSAGHAVLAAPAGVTAGGLRSALRSCLSALLRKIRKHGERPSRWALA